jgi:hypothetical protein
LRAGFLVILWRVNYTTLGFGLDFESLGFDMSYIIGGKLDPHSDMVRFSLNGSF